MNAVTPATAAVPTLSIAGERTLRSKLGSVDVQLSRDGVSEVCCNRPGLLHVERAGVWEMVPAPDLTLERLESLAILAGNLTGQDVGPRKPLCYTNLPNGERLTIARPPVVRPDRISLTIRRRANRDRSFDDLVEGGLFDEAEALEFGISGVDEQLLAYYRARDWRNFFPLAIRARKNIVLAGKPGSGKTTTMEALTKLIPADMRVITIEDTPEIDLDHDNAVQLYYSKGGLGTAQIGADELVEATLRMYPGLTLFGELRDAAALPYFRAVAAGNPGITTLHANTVREVFPALTVMIRQHQAARTFDDKTLRDWLRGVIDVAAHFERRKVAHPDGSVREAFRCTEVYFRVAANENRIGSDHAAVA